MFFYLTTLFVLDYLDYKDYIYKQEQGAMKPINQGGHHENYIEKRFP